MPTEKQILSKLLKLPSSDRAEIATVLIHSLDQDFDSGASEAWLAEVERRAAEVSSGSVKLEGWTKVRKRIEAKQRARHG